MLAFRTRKFYSPVLANQVDLTGRSSNVYVTFAVESRTEAANLLAEAGVSYGMAVSLAEEAEEVVTNAFIKEMRIIPID